MVDHPILGNVVIDDRNVVVGRVYTRTLVLWAIGLSIQPQTLWENVGADSILTIGWDVPSGEGHSRWSRGA